MKPPANDAIGTLERLASGGAPNLQDEAREEEIRRSRPAVVAELAKARERADAGAATDDVELLPLERDVAVKIKVLEDASCRLQEARQRADRNREQLSRQVERLERALSARAALPRELLELEDVLHGLRDEAFQGNLPSTWPAAARERWHGDLARAGRVLSQLKLCVSTPEQMTEVRALLQALNPGRFAREHGDLCQAEEIPVRAGGLF